MRFYLVLFLAVLMVFGLVGCSGMGGVTTSQTQDPPPPTPAAAVTTRNYDNMRSAVNSQETQLTPTSVTTAHFGKLFTLPVDGHVFGQPLYVPGLSIGGKTTM